MGGPWTSNPRSFRVRSSRYSATISGDQLKAGDREADFRQVELAFADTKLRSICESRKKAMTSLGVTAASALEQKLAELDAFGTVAEFLEVYEEDTVQRSPTEMAIRLADGVDLIFCVGHIKVPQTSLGATDWSKVTRVRITGLEESDG